MKKTVKRILIVFVCLAVAGILAILCINAHVKNVAEARMITADGAVQLRDADCIIVLGCGVKADGRPSAMLEDRLKRGVELYKNGAAPKIIMSGDHGQKTYDEVNVMKKYATAAGVPSEDVFMDHAGFSTYETVYRAKEIFGADKVIIVTQKYHLYRTLYIAEKLGVNAYGVDADLRSYSGQIIRDAREVLARCKDFVKVILKPEPTFLGESIPVSGDGNITND